MSKQAEQAERSKADCPPPPVNSEDQRNFWEVDGFKRQLQRVGDAKATCDSYSEIFKDLAGIMKRHENELRKFADQHYVWMTEGCTTIGAARDAIFAFGLFVDDMAEVWKNARVKLQGPYQATQDFKSETFEQSRAIDTIEKKFQQDQKEFRRRSEVVEKTRAKYHTACRDLEKTKAKGKSESDKKMNDALSKLESEVAVKSVEYKAALESLRQVDAYYCAKMGETFDCIQQLDRARYAMVKSQLQKVAELFSVENSQINCACSELHNALRNWDVDVDTLGWYAGGPVMPFTFPTFEPYCSAAQSESANRGSTVSSDSEGSEPNGADTSDDNDLPIVQA